MKIVPGPPRRVLRAEAIKAQLGRTEAKLTEVCVELAMAEQEAANAAARAAASQDEDARCALETARDHQMVMQRAVAMLHAERGELQQALKTAGQVAARPRKQVHGAVRDADGFDLRPDPLQVTTAGELVRALDTYRIWAGVPPYREIAQRAGSRVAASTICTALKNHGELPALKVVLAVVTGCGGDEEDQSRFATAWRRLRLGDAAEGQTSRPPDLRVVTAT
jgi:hypothetical protein